MKLNLWQWLGVALLIVGAVLLAIKYTANGSGGSSAPPGGTAAPAATQPAK